MQATVQATVQATGPCEGFERRARSGKTVSLLAGKLTLEHIEGLDPRELAHDIMAAPPAEEQVTRLFLEAGGKKLVILAEDLFKRTGPDLAAWIRKSDEFAADADLEPFSGGGLTGIRVVPRHLHADHEKAALLVLYVVTGDGLLSRVGFFVNPGVVPESAGCMALARTVAETLAAGPRRADLAGGAKKLAGAVSLDVPPGMLFVTEPGPDFTVYHVYPITSLEEPSGAFNVYVGNFPSNPEPGATIPGKLFGAYVAWREQREGKARRRQALAELPWFKGTFVHVFYDTWDDATLASFEKMARSLRKTGP